jgi:hypothetical protein
MEEKKFVFKRSFSDGANRELIINKNFLKFADKDFENPYTIFEKNEIKDYRYGIRWIRFELTYGREYQIYIRNFENQVIKLSFKSYFGRKKQELHNLYVDILDELWERYFSYNVDELLNKYENNEEFTIADVYFKKEGIELNISGIFNQKRVEIVWKNIRTKTYHTYFSIYSTENPANLNRGYNYKEDWNTNVLYSVLRTILKRKGIESH